MLGSKISEIEENKIVNLDEEIFDTSSITQQPCNDWNGRSVTHWCPKRNCSNDAKCKVDTFLTLLGLTSFFILIIGSTWKNSMNDTQKTIIKSIGGCGAISSLLGLLVNRCLSRDEYMP